MKTMRLILILSICGLLTGCWLTDRGPNGEPSPAEQAAGGAATGFVSGGPIGALLGGLGGLLVGGGAAIQQRRGRDKILRQVVLGVGQYMQEASEDETNKLRQLLMQATDEKSKVHINKHRSDAGLI